MDGLSLAFIMTDRRFQKVHQMCLICTLPPKACATKLVKINTHIILCNLLINLQTISQFMREFKTFSTLKERFHNK